MMATLLLSRGTPMILAGDEFGRTQGGNNNAYCQDDEISWLDWDIKEKGQSLIRFVSDVAALRRRLPVLHRTRFLSAEWNDELGVKDVTWLTPNDTEMAPEQWDDASAHCMGVLLDGRAQATGIARRGDDQTLLLVVNSYHDVVPFKLPTVVGGTSWHRLIDTNLGKVDDLKLESRTATTLEAGTFYDVTGRSLLLFELVPGEEYGTARVERGAA